MTRFQIWSFAGFAVFIAVLVGALWYARQATIAALDNPQAKAEWNVWREETVTLSTSTSPEKRRPQRATEPPMLIVMRDHFGACVVTTVLMGTIAYWFVALAARGAFRGPESTARIGPTQQARRTGAEP